jgi:hypothetical protein
MLKGEFTSEIHLLDMFNIIGFHVLDFNDTSVVRIVIADPNVAIL